MKVAVVFFPSPRAAKTAAVAQSIARGIEANGHQVDLIDGTKDVNSKLTIYGYIVVGTAAVSFLGGSIPDMVARYLSNSGIVAGKKSFAFVMKSGLRTTRTLAKLMKVMEQEGMFIKYSEIITSPEEAEYIGKKLHIST